MVFFGVAAALAILLTPERFQFTQRWIWLAGLIAFVIALPNIIWQVAVVRRIDLAARFPRRPARSRHRFHLLIALAEFIVMHGKNYYVAPAYPMLFAAGGAGFERIFARRCLSGRSRAGRASHLVTGEIARLHARDSFRGPTDGNIAYRGVAPALCRSIRLGRNGALGGAGLRQLPPEEQKRAAIFCQNYGEAGAIDFFGSKYGLPPALSGHQNYFYWGPDDYTGEIMIVLDDDATDEGEQFSLVEDRGLIESSPWAMPWEQRLHIFVCRDLKIPLRELWPKVRVWL